MAKQKLLPGKYLAMLAAFIMAAMGASAWASEDWVTYRASDYGFSMLVPSGTEFVEREGPNGWAELYAEYDGVQLYGLTKRGEQATAAEIEAVGLKITGIPASKWTTINSGKNQNGWKWYETVEASQGDTLIVGDYGTGPSGSYLLLLRTTSSDYRAHKADYISWYNSIRLF
mgnify:CR=1 FL=1